MVVTLEWWELELAAAVGVRRQAAALRSHLTNQRHVPEGTGLRVPVDDLWLNIVGACGELAAAKACGVYWDGSVDTFRRGGDLGPGWQVRTSLRPPGRLLIRPQDRDDDVFILVVGLCPWQLRVAGWITANEGRRVGKTEGYNGLPPACFVCPGALHPIVDLITEIRCALPG